MLEFFQVVRKGGSGDAEFFLNLPRDHAGRMGGKEEAENLQAGLGAQGGEAVGGAGDEKWIWFVHISIIAVLQKNVKLFFCLNLSCGNRILTVGWFPKPGNSCFFVFDRFSVTWDNFCFWGYHDLL